MTTDSSAVPCQPISGGGASDDELFAAEARVMLLQGATDSLAAAATSSLTSDLDVVTSNESLHATLCTTATNLMVGATSDPELAAGVSSGVETLIIGTLSLMIALTIIGNILVILSVLLVKKLRHPSSNYLLVSLAISDLCVAVLVMPLALYQEVSSQWNLGPTVCNMWVSFDVSCCTASILNLCMISIDRYLAITRPLTYGVSATTRRTLSFIVGIWIASGLISVPPLLIMGNEHGTADAPDCGVSQNIGYQLYATLGAFYIPLAIMFVMYYKIYIAAKRVVEAEMKAQPASSRKKQKQQQRIAKSRASSVRSLQRQESEAVNLKAADDSSGENGHSRPLNGGDSNRDINGSAVQMSLLDASERRLQRFNSEASRRSSSSALRERKASITLGFIMGAFTVCWLPFFILALLRPFSRSVYNIPGLINSFALWLGYANSMLNPIIYVTFHQDFRKAFKYLLCLQCASIGTRLREEAYQSQFGCTSYSVGHNNSTQGPSLLTSRLPPVKESNGNGNGNGNGGNCSSDWTHRSPHYAQRQSPEKTSFEALTQPNEEEVKV